MKGETLRLGGDGPTDLRGSRPDGLRGEGGKGETTGSSISTVSPPTPLSAAPLSKPKASPPKAKTSPPRRKKHVPQRMCVACRERDAKRGLYRIVRTPEGVVEPDPTGRHNGRGAYLCGQAACWEKALASGILARALNVNIDTETIDALRRYAVTLPLESSTAVGAAQHQGGER